VRVSVGDGRSRLVLVHRRGSLSAASVLACSRRDSSIGWLGKLYQVTQRRYTRGIEKWCSDLPGPRSPVSRRSLARVIWGFRCGCAGSKDLGASPVSGEANRTTGMD
jgi:hypothetical protein